MYTLTGACSVLRLLYMAGNKDRFQSKDEWDSPFSLLGDVKGHCPS